MHVAIHHVKRLRLSAPVREIHVECQMEPRSEGGQGLHSFNLRSRPKTKPFRRWDDLGNIIHALDNPREVSDILIVADSIVSLSSVPILPEQFGEDDRARLKAISAKGAFWDYLQPTDLTRVSKGVAGFIEAQALDEHNDPLVSLRRLHATIHRLFEPVAADGGEINLDRSISQARLSPVSAAHLMVAIARHWGVPARIAAGLNIDPGLTADQKGEVDLKSADGRAGEGRLLDRSAIWAEIFLPDAEWVGFDPLAGTLIGLGHVKMAVGRDQRDLPRIKHVYKGDAEVELTTAISLGAIDTADGEADEALLDRSLSQISGDDRPQRKRPAHLQAAQQQQQQQQ